jgi:RNA polymerase sigma-70 factor (ECF subfamily)
VDAGLEAMAGLGLRASVGIVEGRQGATNRLKDSDGTPAILNEHGQMPAPGLRSAVKSELVVRAQAGDREAFEALATNAYERLYGVARRVLRDSHAAEDAVQEALIRCWRDMRSLRDPDRFDAWLHRLLINACHDQSRSSRRFAVEVREIDVDRSDPTDDYAQVANRDELQRAFMGLSIDQRAVIVLTHYVGLPADEVGQILGIPSGTVYSRLHYGVLRMRDALTKSLAQPEQVQ